MIRDPITIGIAGVCAWTGVAVSIWQILNHLRNYTEPVFQRYIVRIIFMVPSYAIASFFSLLHRDASIYFDTIRDCYEAWVIYNFLALCMSYVGGPGSVVMKSEGVIVHPSWSHTTCCLPPMAVDGFFLRRCKQGTLQFVFAKPILAAITLLLYAFGHYEDGDWSYKGGYLYLSIMYNICYTMALYALVLFYLGAADLLKPFKPLLKFVLIKTVIFLTFWQGLVISMIASWVPSVQDTSDQKALQNFMICVEMLCAACMLLIAFPHTEYHIGGAAQGMRFGAMFHALSLRDVIADVVHQFAPTYHEYVLYSDGGPAENVKRKKFLGQGKAPSEHPKASMLANMEGGMLSTIEEGGESPRRGPSPDGKQSKAGRKQQEATRNQAQLLDSDSDAMDSDCGDNQLGTLAYDSEEEDPWKKEPEVTPAPAPGGSSNDKWSAIELGKK